MCNHQSFLLAFHARSHDNPGVRQTIARVTAIESMGHCVRVRLFAPEVAAMLEPGRPVLAQDRQAYLRRTWWPCAIHSDGFSILLRTPPRQMREGDDIDVLGPIGRGFQIDGPARSLLMVSAGSHAPDPDLGPLLALVEPALAEQRSVTLAYAAPDADEAYPVSALPPAIEVIRADPAHLINLLSDAIGWADQVFVCGPMEFVGRLAMHIGSTRFPVPRSFLQVLTPVSLPCGTGVCHACWIGNRQACVSGPVFAWTPALLRTDRRSRHDRTSP